MASAAAASRQTSMLRSLLSARSHNSSTVRSLSLLSPSTQRPSVSSLDTSNYPCTRRQHRFKHVSVTHSTSYTNAINSQHGHQLNLALEESRGKDDGPFDPFSQFLDLMGHASEDGNDEGMEVIEDAEFEEIDEEAEEDMSDDDQEDGDDENNNSELETLPKYTTTGALFRPKSQRYALRSGYPAGGKLAVIQLSGFQHKVTPDDLLVVNKLKPVSEWSVGSTHTLKDEDVLLVADQNQTLVGLPGVKGAQVEVMVEEITRDKTVVVFKKRRRKHSRRKNGHRRQVTFLRVLKVKFPDEERGNDAGDLNDIDAKAVA